MSHLAFKPRQPHRRPRRAGLVLVLVLIVVAMVALAGFTFVELMFTEHKAAHLHGDQLQLQQGLHSGIEQLQLFVEQSSSAQAVAGGAVDNPALFRAVPLRPDSQRTSGKSDLVRFSVVAPADMPRGQQPGIRFGLENESGRLHLGDLLRFEQKATGSAQLALMQLPGMTEPVADAILDWIDPDSQPRPLGAEQDYYDGLPRPYAIRNGLPECIEELLLVKGVTRALLFGADRNLNHRLDPDELRQADGSTTRTDATASATPWSKLLTLYSGQRNVNSAGLPRINLNDPKLPQLQQRLASSLDPNLAAFVIAYRQFGPSSSQTDPIPDAVPVDVSKSPAYELDSVLDLIGARVALPPDESGDEPKVYASPLSGDPRALGIQLTKLMDLTTTSELPLERGRISVNHAPLAVLRAIPGIDPALAGRIIAARQGAATGENASRQFATWLLIEGLVDLPTMKSLMPYVSGGGNVVRAQVVAHFDQPRHPMARAEVVIDGTAQPARTLVWRDLRMHGPGYPLEWLAGARTPGGRN